MGYYQDNFTTRHQTIVDYFRVNGFGSNMPILTYLSILDPMDRCIILERIFDEDGGDIVLLDKLLLAYVKIGRNDLAEELIEIARENGEAEFNIMGLEQKLMLGMPAKMSSHERLSLMKRDLSLTNDRKEMEFLNILIKFIS